MAEDRRIIKTKRSLKQALCTLLAEKPFEQLTVKDICAQSSISRITFYTHYTDKFDLLGDLFLDFSEAAIARFQAFQAENNPKKDAYVSCQNLLDSLLDLYFDATGALSDPLTEEEMAEIDASPADCRLIKGQVFLWEGASDWREIWT